ATAKYDMGAYEKTGADTYPPYIFDYFPAPASTGNANNTPISFKIYDSLSGVSINTLQLTVNSQQVLPTQITANGLTYLVTYNPATTFNYNSEVSVTISVYDVSNNYKVSTYSFTIGGAPPETTPPTFNNFNPTPNSNQATPNQSIILNVEDSDSGVSQNSIRMWVKGIEVTNSLNITGNSLSYQASYTPSISFSYGEVVTVSVYAKDLLNNEGGITYSYSIVTDTTAPAFNNLIPTPGATNIIPTHSISLNIIDNETGVSLNTIQFILNGVNLTNSLNITGNINNYTITLPSPNLSYLTTVFVTINAQDLSGNPGSINYSFQTKDDTTPPTLSNFVPTRNSSNVPHDTNISFTITDFESGISDNAAIFFVNGIDVLASANISGNINQVDILYDPEDFGYLETIEVTFSIKDKRNNTVTTSYTFITEPDSIAPLVFNHSPSKSGTGAQNSPINFDIADYETGVSVDTVTISVLDSNLGIITGNLSVIIIGSGPTYNCSFTHDQDFGILSYVFVTINATDVSGNVVTDSYFFIAGEDLGAPIIQALNPSASAVNVPANSTITIKIYDNETDILPGSIFVTVNINNQNIIGTLNIIGGPVTYNAIFTPSPNLTYGQTVQIQAEASDLGNPANKTIYNYSFIVEADTYPPSAPILSTPSIPLAPATTNIGIFTVTGSAEADSTVHIYSNGVLRNSGIVSTNGLFSIQVVITDSGYNTVNALCEDLANNRSVTSNSFIIFAENKVSSIVTDKVTADINLPVGAVSFDATVSFNIAPTENDTVELAFLLPFSLNILDASGNIVQGIYFQNPVIVTLNLKEALSYPPDQVSIYYFNTNTNRWQNDGITIISISTYQIVFSTTHFTKFGVVGLKIQPSLRTLDTFVAPNPVNLINESIHFIYRINRDDANIKIYVYDLSGQKIWQTEEDVVQSYGEIVWDGRDQWGEILANGVYIAYIVAEDGNYRKVKRVKIAVLK
ncbi:MAG: hypothetical protein KKA19_07870, partial [Candidatus Margulisbacteria bacterium]|nr:hypothetical protein [Candidatus Margulisiibacteriota bacterium]